MAEGHGPGSRGCRREGRLHGEPRAGTQAAHRGRRTRCAGGPRAGEARMTVTVSQLQFSAPMIQALRNGTKTMTRRLVRGQALRWLEAEGFNTEYVALPENQLCPWGYKGSLIWVREAWRVDSQFNPLKPS